MNVQFTKLSKLQLNEEECVSLLCDVSRFLCVCVCTIQIFFQPEIIKSRNKLNSIDIEESHKKNIFSTVLCFFSHITKTTTAEREEKFQRDENYSEKKVDWIFHLLTAAREKKKLYRLDQQRMYAIHSI